MDAMHRHVAGIAAASVLLAIGAAVLIGWLVVALYVAIVTID
ncbi:hypothetical protein [Pigmentiphaga sp.]|nr:hypothetical protein [Pigmentiphaga sp.]